MEKAIFQFAERRETEPAPRMAAVLACVVETGQPVTVLNRRENAAARSEDSP